MGSWQITYKDLLILSRDRRALAVLLAMPLVFIAILGFSTGQMLTWRARNDMLQIAVVDEDGSDLAAEFIESLRRRPELDVLVADDRQAARGLVAGDDRVAAVFIGEQFDQRVGEMTLKDMLNPDQGRLAEGLPSLDIELYAKEAMAMTRIIVEQVVFGQAMKTLIPHVAKKNPLVGSLVTAMGQTRDSSPAPEKPSGPQGESVGSFVSYGSKVYQVLVPSYTVMFMFFLVNIMGRSFIAERDLGTLRRLRAAPITPAALLTGKTIPFYLVSLIQGVLLLVCGKFLFGMTWGPEPLLLIPVLACTSLAATALGLLIASVVRTDAQVSAYANLLVITLAGISGCFMPRSWMPELMRKISYATPHSWSLIAFDQLLTEAEPLIMDVWRSCGMLVAFAFLFFALGWWRLHENG